MEHLALGLAEVKFASGDTADGTFSGYGAAFNNVDSYGDVIKPGAFKRTLREGKKAGAWPAMLSQHGGWGMSSEDMMPIGIWTKMEEDDKGLFVEGKLALETRRGADAYALLKMSPRPALDGMSIGYIAKKFTLGTKPEEPRRLLEDVELLEVSLVTWPANRAARVDDVKAGVDEIDSLADAERFLSELRGPISRKAATAFVSRLKRLAQGEPADVDDEVRQLSARFAKLSQREAGDGDVAALSARFRAVAGR